MARPPLLAPRPTLLLAVVSLLAAGLSNHVAAGDGVLLVPCPARSHVRYFAQVGRPLVERGHAVYALINAACRKARGELSKAGITLVTYGEESGACAVETSTILDPRGMDVIMNPPNPLAMFAFLREQSALFVAEADILFSDSTAFQRLSGLRLDLAVVDGIPIGLYNYIVPHKLGIPHITLTTGFSPLVAGVPDLPSYAPVMLNGQDTERMTFMGRVRNALMCFTFPLMMKIMPGSDDSLVVRYAPETEPLTILTLQRRSRLWLVNTDTALDYPRASLPHIVHIGGLSTLPAKPLPAPLAALADGAGPGGLVVISFGSLLPVLPEPVLHTLLEAMERLRGVTTVVWKYQTSALGGRRLPPHVHQMEWLPQGDLLGHPNTRVFVTHCGNNGQFEALYHGVAMLGIPVFGDQPYNAIRMVSKGFGLWIPLHELTPDKLVASIHELLHNQSYTDNIRKASAMYRSQPMTARQRAVYWIEHVLRFGGDHLLSYGLELPWYQFWLLDVLAFLLAISVTVALLLFLLTKQCCRLCLGGRSSPKVKQN